jgi:hypothetical protein
VALANRALDEVRRAYWNELRDTDEPDAAKRFKDGAPRVIVGEQRLRFLLGAAVFGL